MPQSPRSTLRLLPLPAIGMMSQRVNLFNAGFTAFLPSLHFSRYALLQKLSAGQEIANTGACVTKLEEELARDESAVHANLEAAKGLADYFELTVPELPKNVSSYFDWQQNFAETFENRFPMSRIDHYYYLYGRKNAEIICNTGLVETYLKLTKNCEGTLEFWSGIDKSIKDIEYILFKLIAASALLSSEPRQSFFSNHYKSISNDFRPFRQLDATKIEEIGMEKLIEDLLVYRNSVTDGFQECSNLLKELQY